jgi:hypothetical protein
VTEKTAKKELPCWVLQMIDISPQGSRSFVYAVWDIASLSVLAAWRFQRGGSNFISALEQLTATHGWPGSLLCDDSVEFRNSEFEGWAGAHGIGLDFRDLSAGRSNRGPGWTIVPSPKDGKPILRVEFGSLAQADFYLDLCQEILKDHVTAPGRAYRFRTGARHLSEQLGRAGYSRLLAKTNIETVASNWIHHTREILEPAFIRGFEDAIETAAESGFICHSSPALLAGIAIDEIHKTEEMLARILKS